MLGAVPKKEKKATAMPRHGPSANFGPAEVKDSLYRLARLLGRQAALEHFETENGHGLPIDGEGDPNPK